MNTVWQTAFQPYSAFEASSWTPSYRQVLDVGDWEACRSMHAPGQSGRPFDRHYGDMVRSWQRVEYHPMTFSLETLEPHVRRTLTLEPSTG